MVRFEPVIAREADGYPELRDLHAGERTRVVNRAINRLRRRRPYWAMTLAALAPGVVLILLATQESLQARYWRPLAWFAGAYAAVVIVGSPWLVRWLFRRALREVMRQRDLRPSVCFRCGYDLRATTTGICPECGEKIGRKDTALRRAGQTRKAPPC